MSNSYIKSQIEKAINSKSAIEISYRNFDGTSTIRRISNIKYNNKFRVEGYKDDHIDGYCHLRNEERTFKIARINDIKIL